MGKKPRNDGNDGLPGGGSDDGSCPEMSEKSGQADRGLTPRQEKAVDALLQEPGMGRAAVAAAVSERTLRRWMREPRFRAAVHEGRREMFSQAMGLTQRYAPVAVATLVKVMNDATAAHSAKVTAAGLLLRFGRESLELCDVEERVAALEQAAGGSNGRLQ